MHVILFEHHAETGNLLERILQKDGARVTRADTMGALESLISGLAYDACVLDLDIEPGSVIDTIARVSAADRTLSVMVTASSDEQSLAVRALEAGAKLFLRKPLVEQEAQLKLRKLAAIRSEIVRSRHLLGDLMDARSDLRIKVAERERYLTQLIDAAPFAIYSTDHEGRILSFNEAARSLYGYENAEVVGQPVTILLEPGKDGKDMTETPGRCTHVAKDGSSVAVVGRIRRIVNELGQHLADLHIVEDVSERERTEAQLLKAERLSALGKLAPQLAHEFKSPIQVITAAVDLTKGKVERTYPEAGAWLDKVLKSASELNLLVAQMLSLGKPSDSEASEVDLGDTLKEVVDSLEPLGFAKYVDLHLSVERPYAKFMGDAVEIGQAIRNLVVNAIQAMDDTPNDRLELRVFPDDQDIVLEVKDQGVGIAAEKLDDVFEPFFTTKSSEVGTGLGLTIVKKVVDRHNGQVEVSSVVGEGTTFRLIFPTS